MMTKKTIKFLCYKAFFFLFLVFFVAYTVIFSHKTHAATPRDYHVLSPQAAQEAVSQFGELNIEKSSYTIFGASVLAAPLCYGMGVLCGPNIGEPGTSNYFEPGIQSLSKLNKIFYTNPPANLAIWIQDTGHNLGFLPKPVYAQGIGFNGLLNLLNIWKIFRNIAYALISFFIIILGFMIMFRTKIDPQTVVSIQEALPRVIIVLILITFSYAIAGLFVDLMYVVLLISYQLFASIPNFPAERTFFSVEGPLELQSGLRDFSILDMMLRGDLIGAFSMIFPNGIFDFFDIGSKIFNQNVITQFLGGLAGMFLLMILIFILLIRLFFMFLGAYINLIIYIVFGPLFILTGILPGNNSILNWIKNIVANLSVFAVSGIIFMLTIMFNTMADTAIGNDQAVWTPPYVMIGSNAQSISALFSIGILLMLPGIVNKFKQAIKSEGETGLVGGVLGGVSQAIGLGFQAYNFLQSREHTKLLREQVRQQGAASSGSSGGDSHHK